MEKIRVILHSSEAHRLFQILVKTDASVRKLALYAQTSSFPPRRFRFLYGEMEDAFRGYHQFLHRMYKRLEPVDQRCESTPYHLRIQRYKNIMSGMHLSGTRTQLNVSTPLVRENLSIIKRTDVCVRICELYAYRNLNGVIELRREISEQISLLQKAERNCTNDLLSFTARVLPGKRKRTA